MFEYRANIVAGGILTASFLALVQLVTFDEKFGLLPLILSKIFVDIVENVRHHRITARSKVTLDSSVLRLDQAHKLAYFCFTRKRLSNQR